MQTAQESVIDPNDPPTFEKVWRMFQETDRKMKETDRQMKETGRKIEETARQMKETDKKVGELTNRFGRVVEHRVVPNLLDKFKSLGFTFEVATRNYKIADEKNGIFVEVDTFLENGDKVMIVEIKTTPRVEDITDHVERMEKLRKRADLRGDTRKYLGALAGVVMSDSVKNKALGNGFSVIVPSGDTFDIIRPEGKYRLREW
jgi:hypothetical protein